MYFYLIIVAFNDDGLSIVPRAPCVKEAFSVLAVIPVMLMLIKACLEFRIND